MKFKLKLIFGLFCIIFPLFNTNLAQANNAPINAYLFHGEGCPHCAEERDFIYTNIIPNYPNLELKEYEIYKNRQNGLFLQKIAKKLNVNVSGVPFLIIGNESFVGYLEGVTSKEIQTRIEECSLSACPDSVASIAESYPADDKTSLNNINTPLNNEITSEKTADTEKKVIKLPLLGKVDALSFSLPILTIVMGVLDGFNPCAMWVLLFLISFLLGMKNKKRMWLLGIAFIVASALVYFIFMAAWLNLIIFLGFIVWVRIVIALAALFGGGYSLRDYFVNKKSGCKVEGSDKKRKTFERIKTIVQQNSIWLALGGIILLAFAINLVELICSAGLPAVYTQILALNDMASWKYYLYILMYVFFFMLDDLIIFIIAMTTLQATGITTKYSRASRLIGGIVMVIIGILLLFKPEWLMFG